MVKLGDIIVNIETLSISGSVEVEISSLEFDSRMVGDGALFFALAGTQVDGHNYIERAVELGAKAVVCERLPEKKSKETTYIEVNSGSVAMGRIAATFYGEPSGKLKLVGITGTNGKTTTATLLYDLFRGMGYKAGLISTIVCCVDDRCQESSHTTPDAISINALIKQMVDRGCDYCFMEVSSHSLVQHRVEGLSFAGAVFTNITHEHLDYHQTFANYIAAKKMLFDSLPKRAFALINRDDRNAEVMVQNTQAQVKTLSLRNVADFECRVEEMHFDGMLLNINREDLWVKMIGRFNAYNLLSVYATATLLGAKCKEILRGITLLEPVSGRLEYIESPAGVTAIVDYAHTPDALQNVMDAINEIRTPDRKLYVVVGCGGNRDRVKRPVMAKIAATGSDLVILTSDNPRMERPEQIIEEMKVGLSPSDHYLAITNRKEAIEAVATMAKRGDIVLIAGKGHETYQEIAGKREHFDDHEVFSEFMARRGRE